jgi:hypothetical protein
MFFPRWRRTPRRAGRLAYGPLNAPPPGTLILLR